MKFQKYKFNKKTFKEINQQFLLSASEIYPEVRNQIIVLLLFRAGLKPKEICALSWRDVYSIRTKHLGKKVEFDVAKKMAINSKSFKRWEDEQNKYLAANKVSKSRSVIIGKKLRKKLKEFHEEILEVKNFDTDEIRDQPLICSYDQSISVEKFMPLKPDTISDLVKRIALNTQFQDFTASKARKLAIQHKMLKEGLYDCGSPSNKKLEMISTYFGYSDNRTILKFLNK